MTRALASHEHNKSDILPIVELDGRSLCPQQRREKRYWEISKLTNTKIHRHGIAWRIHAIASIWNRAGKRARVLPTAFRALHPLCVFAGILCRDSPAEKLALSRDRTSSAAAQRNSKVSSSLRWWISAAWAICIIYFTPAQLSTPLAESRGIWLIYAATPHLTLFRLALDNLLYLPCSTIRLKRVDVISIRSLKAPTAPNSPFLLLSIYFTT